MGDKIMPIYEFECEKGHRLEKIFSIPKCPDRVICDFVINFVDGNLTQERCGLLAEKVWSIPVTRFEAAPTIIFRNPRTGETQVATHKNDQPPKGYIREELRGPIERSRFEKEATQRKYVEDELTTEYLKQGREQTAKNLHDDLKARMNATTNTVYNPETKQEENITWDEQTKGMLKTAMNYTRKRHAKIKPKRTNVRLEVNHTDSSNLIK